MNAPLAERIAQDHARAESASPPGGAPRRQAALAALAAQGLPTSRDENWKYANLRGLERLHFVPATSAASGTPDIALPAALPGFLRYVFVDGRFAPALSAAPGGPFTTLASAGVAGTPARSYGTDGRFALLNEAFATDGALIRVPGGTPARLELIFLASAAAESGSSYPRIELELGAGAQLELVERHLSAAALGSFVNSAVQIGLAHGAQLKHYRLQELSARTTVFDTLDAEVGPDASYRLHTISLGGQSARSTLALKLTGERAALALAVVALGDRQQVQDCFAQVEHLAPRARTTELFRGIAAARSRVAFNGKVVVAREAVGTDSSQSLRGLLAGPEAEIDVRPQLEIYTDDVRASHGATAGKLDEAALFYLLSRGIDRDSAQRLLKWAFLEDAITNIEVPELRRQIELSLATALQDETLKELL